MRQRFRVLGLMGWVVLWTGWGYAAESDLTLAEKGVTKMIVVVSPEAGLPAAKAQDGALVRGLDVKGLRNGEWAAANDLVKYIEMMTGAKPRLAFTREEIEVALKGKDPVVLVGEEALKAYRTDVELKGDQVKGAVHLIFPGLFNECWLYVNGVEVGYRTQGKMWWINDYNFQWDVDLSGKLKAGTNTIALRANCEHHFGGLFRRPFLYAPVGQ